MIKFAVRRNLIYPLQLLLWNFFRDTETKLLTHYFQIDNFEIYTPLMFTGELLAGSILFFYQYYFLKGKSKEKKSNSMEIKYIYTKRFFSKRIDAKSYFLIITSAFSDFSQFVLTLQLHKYMTISGSLEQRLRGNFTLYNAFFYYFALKLAIFRHQSFSLIIISFCLLIIIITEFIFQEFNIFLTYGQFIIALLFMFFIQFGNALVESIEKYLFENYQTNPFFVLMNQGIFGLIFFGIYCIFYNPFKDIAEFQKTRSTSDFVILIFAFILFIILSGGKNSFRVITTKIYSPMTTTFMDYILNPFYLIYYFTTDQDFKTDGEKNYGYFIINLIIAVIITFRGGVYNEFVILFCYGLDRDTHSEVTKRSEYENELNNIRAVDEEDND